MSWLESMLDQVSGSCSTNAMVTIIAVIGPIGGLALAAIINWMIGTP